MTTAYNFPDLDISPIDIEEFEDESFQVGDEQTTLPVYVPLEQSLKGLTVSGRDPSSSISVVPDSDPTRQEAASEEECFPESSNAEAQEGSLPIGSSQGLSLRLGDSFDETSEEAFVALQNRMKNSLFPESESCDIAAALDEDSFCNILNGCRVCVEMGCCKESAEDVRSRLRRMGAVVSRRFVETTTHVVFSYGNGTSVLQSVFASSRRPFLVDPHWVYECFKSRKRVPEESFSLYECRYLVNALRRSLDRKNASGNRSEVLHDVTNEYACTAHGNISEDVEVTFSRSMNASELLMKLDLISKRLDKLGVANSCVLGNRCPSVLKEKRTHVCLPRNLHLQRKQSPHSSPKITRRRTHGAFPLAYREPFSDAVKLARERREELDAVSGINELRFTKRAASKENEEPRCTQCTQPFDPPHVVGRAPNLKSRQVTQEQKNQAITASQKFLSTSENSSEMGGLLGLKTLSQCGVYGPLVETASSMINQLQSANSSAEFVGKKHSSRIVSRTRDGVVFTGFVKEKERELYPLIRNLGLKVHSKISGRTYCVVSANGERTLSTLRAVINSIPVVKPEWVEMCAEHNRLLSLSDFEHERWKELIRVRGLNCRLFADYGKIMVCNECSPPSNDLCWMIEESGGEVTTDPLECSLIVAPQQHSLEIYCSEELDEPPPVVVEKYILDCICENAILDVVDYMEHQVVDDLL